MHLSAIPSPIDLQPWVSGVAIGHANAEAGALGSNHFPALVGSNLAIILEGAVELWEPRIGSWRCLPGAFLTGPQRKPFLSRHFGSLKFISIFVRPVATSSFLREESAHVQDTVIDAFDIWGIQWCRIERQIRDASSDSKRAELLFAFFRNCIHAPGTSTRLSNALRLRAMALNPRPDAVQQLAISTRQYQRRFSDEFGMTPKLFQRIHRLEHVLGHAIATSRHDSELALGHGYYDQAHMARDLRLLAGQPITTLLNEVKSPTSKYWPLLVSRHEVFRSDYLSH